MDPKDKSENAKNPNFKNPVDLPHVKPEDYDAAIDSGRGSAKSASRDSHDDSAGIKARKATSANRDSRDGTSDSDVRLNRR